MSATGQPAGARDLTTLFAPSSVCIVGASSDPASISGRPLRILQQHGFPGSIYPVNPKYDELGGVTCYSSISAIPAPVDVAIIVVAAPRVPELLEQCGQAGIRNAIIISSGFEEDDSASDIVEAFQAAIDRYDLNIIGPNSEGIWSVPHRAMMTFGSAALREEIIEGPVSVISQSGSIGGSTARSLQTRGIGCRYFISAGNETTTSAADYLDFLVTEGGSRAVLLFLEGIDDGERFLAAARRARSAGVHVVVLKAGASEAGSAAAASHTGKITSSADVYSNVFEQVGVIEVDSISHLVDAAEVLITPELALQPVSDGVGDAGIALVAPGATRTVMADTAERLGVPLARFSRETEAALEQVVPTYGYAKNPVDVTAQLSTSGMFGDVLELMANDPATEALLIQWGNRGVHQVDEVRRSAQKVREASGKPVLIGVLGDRWELGGDARRAFREAGVGGGATPDEVLQQLSWLYRARTLQGEHAEVDPAAKLASTHTPGPSWEASAPWLEECGFRVPTSVSIDISQSREDVSAALEAAKLAWPVVVKAHPDAVLHKADLGLVALGVADVSAVVDTLAAFRSQAEEIERYVVQEMAPKGVEALVTVRRDPDFGPILTVGVGGELVEIVKDVHHLALPVTRRQVEDAIGRTRLAQLLAGVRGRDPSDTETFIDAVVGLANRFPDQAEHLGEVELNPVIVGSKGEGAWAVDAIYAGA